MFDAFPGPHHCLGTARTVADIVYRSLHARCIARGGTLSVEEIEHCYAEIIASFSSGFDMFERRHLHCMHASVSTAEMPFARDRILVTILRACGETAARQAFSMQVEQQGECWLRPFFDAFAHYVRTHLCTDADQRLTAAYVETGLTRKDKISIDDLLKHKIVQNVLRDCARPLAEQAITAGLVGQVCDSLEAYAGTAKATEQQTANFLVLLGRQIAMQLPAEPQPHEAELYSLADHKKKAVVIF